MRHTNDMRALLRHVAVAEAFATWLRENADHLVGAADLLGGPEWAARAAAAAEAIADGAEPADLLPELEALRRLLNLEFTDDLTGVEALFFAAVHPDDPRADGARICAEALERGVVALEALGRADSPSNRRGRVMAEEVTIGSGPGSDAPGRAMARAHPVPSPRGSAHVLAGHLDLPRHVRSGGLRRTSSRRLPIACTSHCGDRRSWSGGPPKASAPSRTLAIRTVANG